MSNLVKIKTAKTKTLSVLRILVLAVFSAGVEISTPAEYFIMFHSLFPSPFFIRGLLPKTFLCLIQIAYIKHTIYLFQYMVKIDMNILFHRNGIPVITGDIGFSHIVGISLRQVLSLLLNYAF